MSQTKAEAGREPLEKQNEMVELEAEEESAKAMDADVPQPSAPAQDEEGAAS